MSTELATLKSSMERLDMIAADSALLTTPGNPFSQAITMAGAIKDIRASLTDEVMEEVVEPLMNTKLGFRTDKDPNRPVWNPQTRRKEAPEPYPIGTVRECLIEATLRGLPPVGNCWNIISGQSYVTKEGFWFLIGKRIEGLTDFKIIVGVPKMIRPPGDAKNASDEDAKGALVSCSASWKLHGKEDRLEREIPIRVNAMMGADAIMGKAERKLLAAAHAQITGTSLGDADASETEPAPMRDATPPTAAPPEKPRDFAPLDVPEPVEAPAAVMPPAPAEQTPPVETPTTKEQWLARLEECCMEDGINLLKFEKMLVGQGEIPATATLKSLKPSALEKLHANFRNVIERAQAEGGEG